MQSTQADDRVTAEGRGPAVTLNWMSGLQTFLPPIDFGPPAYSNDSCFSDRESPDSGISYNDFLEDPLLETFQFSNTDSSRAMVTQNTSTHSSTRRSSTRSELKSLHQTRPETATSNEVSDLSCWDHGCNGQVFTTLSNLKRHQREKSNNRASYLCPLCNAQFSRSTARNQHIENRSCNRIRRYSNGRQRVKKRRLSSTSEGCSTPPTGVGGSIHSSFDYHGHGPQGSHASVRRG